MRDPDQGIVHVISPELGIVLPGATVVCPDSHTCTQGAMGAFAWGIGSTEAEHALATGTLRVTRPRTMRVRFEGRLPAGVTAKDLSLAVISRHGSAGGNGYAVEYAGSAVRALDVEARLTLCNMATEFSAMTGLIAPDEKTFEYLEGRRYAPSGDNLGAPSSNGGRWPPTRARRSTVKSSIDAGRLAPMITWGTSPQHAVGHLGTRAGARGQRHEPRGLRAGAGLHGPAARAMPCSRSRSTRRSSARAPTAGSPTCAAPRRYCAAAGSRLA